MKNQDLNSHYYEIVFSINTQENYLKEIINEIISAEILESEEGIEILDSKNIIFEENINNLKK